MGEAFSRSFDNGQIFAVSAPGPGKGNGQRGGTGFFKNDIFPVNSRKEPDHISGISTSGGGSDRCQRCVAHSAVQVVPFGRNKNLPPGKIAGNQKRNDHPRIDSHDATGEGVDFCFFAPLRSKEANSKIFTGKSGSFCAVLFVVGVDRCHQRIVDDDFTFVRTVVKVFNDLFHGDDSAGFETVLF